MVRGGWDHMYTIRGEFRATKPTWTRQGHPLAHSLTPRHAPEQEEDPWTVRQHDHAGTACAARLAKQCWPCGNKNQVSYDQLGWYPGRQQFDPRPSRPWAVEHGRTVWVPQDYVHSWVRPTYSGCEFKPGGGHGVAPSYLR